jgi:hypothetical protein
MPHMHLRGKDKLFPEVSVQPSPREFVTMKHEKEFDGVEMKTAIHEKPLHKTAEFGEAEAQMRR